jgi:hypothetical protein
LRYTRLLLLVPFLAVGPPTVAASFAQEPASTNQASILDSCNSAEHRQFDFWLGDWEVTDTAGTVVGTNLITRVASGCGLLESWRSAANGNEGSSLNWYGARTGRWHQRWVGLSVYLQLEGGIEDGDMVLAGTRQTADGEVIDRITWIPREGGRVRQLWELSADGGKTWQVLFDGMYAER